MPGRPLAPYLPRRRTPRASARTAPAKQNRGTKRFRSRLQRRVKSPAGYAKTHETAPGTSSGPDRFPAARPGRNKAVSSSDVSVNEHVVAEVLVQKQPLGPEHVLVGSIVVEICDYKMFLSGGFDDGRGECILRQIEL